MKKMLTFCAMITGAFMLLFGTSSCKDKESCCEWTYDQIDYRACEDDAIVNSRPGGWGYVIITANYYGGECD